MANPVSAAAATSTINAGIGTLAQNYETFLHLLTTQLKNQDPLSPLDTNQFTQQLTAMTGVQQQLLTNQLLTQIIGQNQAEVGGAAVNLIGKTVTVETANTELVDHQAQWNYSLASPSAQTKLEILDSSGRVVASFNGATAEGPHALAWDGKDGAGKQLPDGVYNIRITATDTAGKTVGSVAWVTGVASKIETLDGQTLLTVGRSKAPVSAVTSVGLTSA